MLRVCLLATLLAFLAACERTPQPAVQPAVQYPKEILDIAKRHGQDPADVAKARALSRPELQKLVDAYLAENLFQGRSYWRLAPASDLVVPELIAVFERENAFKSNDSYRLVTPASQALLLLDRGVHPQLKTHLLRSLPTADKRALKIIADDLTAFGSDDLLPAVTVLFEHQDTFISSGARSGALEAIKANRAGPDFRAYVWDNSVKLLHSPKPPAMFDPIRLLVAIDAAKAHAIISAPDVLRPDHPLLQEVLQTLNQMKRPATASFLEQLLANPRLSSSEQERTYIQQAALKGLVLQNDPSASEHVERILNAQTSYHQLLVLTAWNLRFELRGLEPVVQAASDAFEKSNFDLESLSPDHRDMIIMLELDSEVFNGGFAQWYSNGGGVHAEAAKKALERISAHKHAEFLQEANRLFGWRGPPNTREALETAIEDMSDANLQKMDAISDAWADLPPWELSAHHWDWQRQTKE